jgi:hypothetical protein
LEADSGARPGLQDGGPAEVRGRRLEYATDFAKGCLASRRAASRRYRAARSTPSLFYALVPSEFPGRPPLDSSSVDRGNPHPISASLLARYLRQIYRPLPKLRIPSNCYLNNEADRGIMPLSYSGIGGERVDDQGEPYYEGRGDGCGCGHRGCPAGRDIHPDDEGREEGAVGID